MNKILTEIEEIKLKAVEFLQNSPSYKLPLHVPYLGMGSSWFAPLAFKYMAITNYPENALGAEASEVISLLAGDEQYSSSKTYINTLLAIFKGFGFHIEKAVDVLVRNMPVYRQLGEKMANELFDLITQKKIHGIYIIGSGPNIATAFEASLILSESTKLCFTGLSMAQYDHGPKETAANSIVIQIIARGKSYERAQKLTEVIVQSGAYVETVEEPGIEENSSIIHNIVPFNFMAYFLAEKLNITETILVGRKVTEVS
jgi:glucosamine--fructose-6-phosphate aminotransferase (isomerizing)